jgi:hypothetical protein
MLGMHRSSGSSGADTVSGSTGGPVGQKSRPLGRVGGKQAGDAPADGVAATLPGLSLATGVELAETDLPMEPPAIRIYKPARHPGRMMRAWVPPSS